MHSDELQPPYHHQVSHTNPPSTLVTWPLTHPAASLTKNPTPGAMSVVSVIRPELRSVTFFHKLLIFSCEK
jgi:hypothetical protein